MADSARKRVNHAQIALEIVLPVPFPVTVRWRKMEGFGESDVQEDKEGKRRAVICLRTGMVPDLAVETFIHEWAHLLAWDYHGRHSDAVWGIAYHETYNAIYGDH